MTTTFMSPDTIPRTQICIQPFRRKFIQHIWDRTMSQKVRRGSYSVTQNGPMLSRKFFVSRSVELGRLDKDRYWSWQASSEQASLG